jgi:hypothetical protein
MRCWLVLVVAMIVGCESNTAPVDSVAPIQNASGKTYKRLIIVAAARKPGARKVVEDAFLAECRARGIDAVVSSDYIPETNQAKQDLFDKVITNSRADGLILTKLAKVERRENATGAVAAPMPNPPGAKTAYDLYAWAWQTVYEPPEVQQADAATLETRLIDTKDAAVAWAGASRVLDTRQFAKDAQDLAKNVLDELAAKGLVQPRR